MIELMYECVGTAPKGRRCRGTTELFAGTAALKTLDLRLHAAEALRCPRCGRLMRLKKAVGPGEKWDVSTLEGAPC